MRTLVISDIHGCLEPLQLMWKVIDPQAEDKIVFVGDYVDRGPDTKGVIDFLMRLPDELDITFLSGNHEEKFMLARYGGSELEAWLSAWGGGETLASYGSSIEDVPESHWEFLRKHRSHLETDTHVIVHANLEHDVPIQNQLPFTLVHKKFGTPLPHTSGKTMICGHTAQKSHVPLNLGHAVCIDTDVGRGGWLCCLHAESDTYWQTNVNGDIREGHL